MPVLEECLCWGQDERLCANKYKDPGPKVKLEVKDKELFLICVANGNSK